VRTAAIIALFLLTATAVLSATAARAATIHVPADRPTVQAGIDAAKDGDVVLVAPGIYRESIKLHKTITLASRFLETGNPSDIENTVLERKRNSKFIVFVGRSAGQETRITGFTIRNGDDGISCEANIHIESNRFLGNKDAIDYEGGGGICRNNVFERNRDDGIDLDKACAILIEDNIIRNNEDDGIEIRLHKYSGPVLSIVIRRNVISGNGEDGIQLIDYPDRSDREFRIDRNLFERNAMAAVGCMSNGNTKEDYEAADIPEPIELTNNTFVGNKYGITGHSTRKTALKNVDGGSIVSHVLFWKNGKDHEGSVLDETRVLRADPMMNGKYRLKAGSPCVDAGLSSFEGKNGRRYSAPEGSFEGAAPDLGAFELHPE
jgi:hypothetical protein